MDLLSTGSTITKKGVVSAIVMPELEDFTKKAKKEIKEDTPTEVIEEEKEEATAPEVKEEVKEPVQTSLDDFYQDFKL